MTRIFLSYRRGDSADVTGRIDDRLIAEFGRDNVFKDVDSIPLGTDFRTHLSDAVGKCDVLLVVMGGGWLTAQDAAGNQRLQDDGDFVRIEVEPALHRDIPVVPVLLGTAEMPRTDQLPEALRELSYRNATRVRPDPDFHLDMDRILAGIKQVRPKSSAAAPSRPPAADVITTECQCGKRLRATQKMAGKSAQCPSCGSAVRFPGASREDARAVKSPVSGRQASREPAARPAARETRSSKKGLWLGLLLLAVVLAGAGAWFAQQDRMQRESSERPFESSPEGADSPQDLIVRLNNSARKRDFGAYIDLLVPGDRPLLTFVNIMTTRAVLEEVEPEVRARMEPALNDTLVRHGLAGIRPKGWQDWDKETGVAFAREHLATVDHPAASADLFAVLYEFGGDEWRERLTKERHISNLSISGDTATVMSDIGPFDFVKVDGRWFLSPFDDLFGRGAIGDGSSPEGADSPEDFVVRLNNAKGKKDFGAFVDLSVPGDRPLAVLWQIISARSVLEEVEPEVRARMEPALNDALVRHGLAGIRPQGVEDWDRETCEAFAREHLADVDHRAASADLMAVLYEFGGDEWREALAGERHVSDLRISGDTAILMRDGGLAYLVKVDGRWFHSPFGVPAGEHLALAYALYLADEWTRSTGEFAMALQDEEIRADLGRFNLYNAACSAALAGSADLAMEWLAEYLRRWRAALAEVARERDTATDPSSRDALELQAKEMKAHIEYARGEDSDLESLRTRSDFARIFEDPADGTYQLEMSEKMKRDWLAAAVNGSGLAELPPEQLREFLEMLETTNLTLVLSGDGTFSLGGTVLGRQRTVVGTWTADDEKVLLAATHQDGNELPAVDEQEVLRDAGALYRVGDSSAPGMVFRKE